MLPNLSVYGFKSISIFSQQVTCHRLTPHAPWPRRSSAGRRSTRSTICVSLETQFDDDICLMNHESNGMIFYPFIQKICKLMTARYCVVCTLHTVHCTVYSVKCPVLAKLDKFTKTQTTWHCLFKMSKIIKKYHIRQCWFPVNSQENSEKSGSNPN